MQDKIQCPICGNMIDPNEADSLDNGSPACPECVKKEQEYEENKKWLLNVRQILNATQFVLRFFIPQYFLAPYLSP